MVRMIGLTSAPFAAAPLPRLAACHARLGRLDEARAKWAEVLQQDPEFHLSAVSLRYKNPADAQHVLGGIRKARLQE